jgi:RNA-directed DNA polymerase
MTEIPKPSDIWAVQLKHWKRGSVIYREMIARGMSSHDARQAAANVRRWWYSSAKGLHVALPNRFFDKLGIPRLAS